MGQDDEQMQQTDPRKKRRLDDLSQELRDIDLGSREESLLYMDPSDGNDASDQFKTMKGLEHLAKLSIDDCELKMYSE